LLSAYGIGCATVSVSRQRALMEDMGPGAAARIEDLRASLTREVRAALADQGVEACHTATRLHLRYAGTDSSLPVAYGGDPDAARDTFEAMHQARFGFISPEKAVTVEAVEVEGEEQRPPGSPQPEAAGGAARPHAPMRHTRLWSGGGWHEAAVALRHELAVGDVLEGPALIVEPNQTIVVEPGWEARLTRGDDVLLRRFRPAERARVTGSDQADPVLLEVFNNLFMNIAEQMGVALQNTAQSVNIKERLDFSCAVFDADGALVANAPHMPVHLGSMDRSVETVIRLNRGRIAPGDVFALNAPYNGGTHLPDITVVTPVFDDAGGEILFWVASRGHHADVGGLAPGSMTPLATSVEEEGILIDNLRLVAGGRFREEALREVLTDHPWPCRNPDQNVADLRAQVAANARGIAELRRMVSEFGLDVVRAYMGHVQDNAAEEVRRLIGRLSDCAAEYPTDTGQVIRVRISVDHKAREAVVDFTGTSEAAANNFNAPEPVTRAAVLYVFRVMVEAPIPMNAGCLRPIRIVVPRGSMLAPEYPRAVVAGNVETSQHVTNALFEALGVLANGQGTMNNLTFGNARHQYYETICSGAPAGVLNSGRAFAGQAGVHVHMTNSRLTDPEILELRFPVLLEEFSLRPGTGGSGAHRGGDGTLRRLRFLEPMDCAILSSHRVRPPRGIAGGGQGEAGRTIVVRRDGRQEELPASAQTVLEAGETITIIPPTPGGYGPAGA
ncbi:MAG: hydantoinase B/oxoprolinase family protein, partial [Rhodobacteraceae bacterium]|nr:hydantoinase B/oxoprolinase family protein [Paracoccaceae bacterium]